MQLAPDGPVLVIGPGAIGTLVAARLAAAGTEVVVAARTAETAKALAADGLVAIGPDGRKVTARPGILHKPTQLEQTPRMVVLATKCSAALPALKAWLPRLDDDAPVVCLQNGVYGDVLAPVLGDRHIECTVSLPATLQAPGVSHQTGPGSLHLGPWPQARDRHDPRPFKDVARLLSAAAPVRASPNMRGVKWTKVVINSCLTGLGVLTGQELGTLLQDRRARDAFLRICEEGYRAGQADGVRFEPVSGFRPALFGKPLPGRDALLRVLGRKYRRQRSSSLQSLERGQKTEIDEINGHLAAVAARHGLAAPVNDAIVRLVHEIEGGRRRPALDNLGLLPTLG